MKQHPSAAQAMGVAKDVQFSGRQPSLSLPDELGIEGVVGGEEALGGPETLREYLLTVPVTVHDDGVGPVPDAKSDPLAPRAANLPFPDAPPYRLPAREPG